MIKKVYFLLVFSIIWACAGSDSSSENITSFNNPVNEALSLIDKFKDDPIIRDTASAIKLMELTENRFDEIKEDPRTPEILIKTAEVAVNMMKYERAISIYEKVLEHYPDDENAPFALFHIAFNYDENLFDKQKAKLNYELFLEKYPDHDFASSVKELLLYIDKTPEEMYRELINRGNELINSRDLNQNE